MMEKVRILIVEDEWVTAEDIRQTLEGMEYEVAAAVASGKEAIHAVRKTAVDLVLMDIVLQGDMDGIAAGSHIYSRTGIPVVYLTAYADDSTLRRAKESGPFGYILKPFSEQDLRVGIEVALEKSRSERRIRNANSILRTIRKVNRMAREGKSAESMIQKACNTLVGAGWYGCVRIMLVDRSWNYHQSAASGPEKRMIPKVEMLPCQSLSRYEKKSLSRRGVFSVDLNDLLAAYGIRTEENQKRTVLLVRLAHEDRVYGILTALIRMGLSAGSEEKELLEELADEIAFGLHVLETQTKNVQNEMRLSASEERYFNIINGSADGMLIVDEAGLIRFANPAAEKILGRKMESLIGQPFGFPMVVGESTELDLVGRDGKMAVAEMRTSEIEHEGRKASLAMLRDITLHKQTQAGLKEALEKLGRAMTATIGVVTMTVEARDPYTAGHQRRVADLSRAIARKMGYSAETVEGIYRAGLIHDIGKIAVPAEILTKPARLSKTEYELIKTHCQAGYDILKDVEFPWPVAGIAVQHHERIDGSGYPRGLKADEILPEARIIAVADVVEAMAMDRPYRPALGMEPALKEIFDYKGVRYDIRVVEACLKIFEESSFQFNDS